MQFKQKTLVSALVLASTTFAGLAMQSAVAAGHKSMGVASVEFTSTPAPSTPADIAKTHTQSKAIVTYLDGTQKEFPLSYNSLFSVGDKVANNPYPAGTLYDANMKPILDPNGLPAVAETPDANSLLKVGNKLFLITHFEYDWLEAHADGSEGKVSGRKPMGMVLTEMEQDGKTGKLLPKAQKPISFANVDGLWIACFGSQSPWNTHLGSEEDYDLQFNPLTKKYSKTQKGLAQLNKHYFNGQEKAKAYHYGYIPEVTVKADGSYEVVKHYSMGRGTWEMTKIMPDGKTAYHGDDGTMVASIMYVADKSGDLTAGTLYAARVTEQTGSYAANIRWIKLGHATDAQVKDMADRYTFDDIFENGPMNADGTCGAGLKRIRAGSTADECLAVKPNMEQAAAFLETRRYAALKGATVEFNKMEGIAVNAKDNKLYMAISYLDKGFLDDGIDDSLLNDHLKMAKINAGATLTMPMAAGVDDAQGHLIASDYVVTNFYIEDMLRGRDIAPDALGNIADPNYIANTDNVFFSEKMRTLFIGEDSGTHVNNFVWAYNVDTKKLSRILSLVPGAEATGLQVVDNLNGHAYIMSNSQHHGDYIKTQNKDITKALEAIGVQKVNAGNVGYIGGMPAIK